MAPSFPWARRAASGAASVEKIRYLYLAAAVMALSTSAGLAYLSVDRPEAHLTLDPAVVDFGTVRQHDELQRSVRLRNTSGQRLSIVEVTRGCECASTTLSRRNLAPDQEATLDVVWRVGARHGASDTSCTLMTAPVDNARNFGWTTVTLRAKVQAEYGVSAEQLTFRRAGGVQEKHVDFWPAKGCEQVDLLEVYTNHLAIDAEIDKDRRRFTVQFDPDQWPTSTRSTDPRLVGRGEARVTLKTTSKAEAFRELKVAVN